METINYQDILEISSLRQQNILEASIKLFAKKGSANTSTAQIAKEAGVSVGTLFHYYKTKDDLLLAIVIPAIKKLFAEMDYGISLENSTSLESYLTELFQLRMNYFKRNWELFQVALKEVFYKEEFKQRILPQVQEEGVIFLIRIVEHFKEKGDLQDLPTEKIVNYIMNIISGFTFVKLLNLPARLINDEEMEGLASFMVNGLK